MTRPRAILAWSSGKDCAWALQILRAQAAVDVVGLLTTINEQFERVAMHAVRSELLKEQARAAGLPLYPVNIPWPCSNEAYEEAMARAVSELKSNGITRMAFGDLFLSDVREYRESKLRGTGVDPIFPLWGSPTEQLARTMIAAGLKARITCVNPKQLPRQFAGRDFDSHLLDELPSGVDPCGERGEFHSFAYAGPMFERPVSVRNGEVVERDGFVFADLMLDSDTPAALTAR